MCQTDAAAVERDEGTRRFKPKSKKNVKYVKSMTEGDEELYERKKQTVVDVGGDNTQVMNIGRVDGSIVESEEGEKKKSQDRVVMKDEVFGKSACSNHAPNPSLLPGMIVRIVLPDEEVNDKLAKTITKDPQKQ